MLHRNKNKQLSRIRKVRNALIKTLAVSLVRDEKITTTEIKAKVLKSFIEKLITKGKEGDLSAQKLLTSKIGPTAARKIVKEIAPKYKERHGGYTRVVKVPRRLSDGAKMSQIEFV